MYSEFSKGMSSKGKQNKCLLEILFCLKKKAFKSFPAIKSERGERIRITNPNHCLISFGRSEVMSSGKTAAKICLTVFWMEKRVRFRHLV